MSRDSPPDFCQYAAGPCDQVFDGIKKATGVFLYPSEPAGIAETIESAVKDLELAGQGNWLTWRKFSISGQVVFCEICKRMRFADFVAADVTTLNFNLMFEIGFALGLGIPVIPIRDASYIKDHDAFRELGLLDTLGYVDFRNSQGLVDSVERMAQAAPLPAIRTSHNAASPIYLLKSRHETEGEVAVAATLRRALVGFRVHDAEETPRLSLHDARKEVEESIGVLAHLSDENRSGARVHNARSALVAGLAVALQKTTVVLQEGEYIQPIDYRDIVLWYSRPDQVQRLLERPLRQVMTRALERSFQSVGVPEGLLQQVDFGDVAAENEIRPLRSYFVQTGQYEEAKHGHARLVVGRKGTGKTAIFYALSDAFAARHSTLMLDLKPEGHQFVRLREAVAVLTPGMQEHTLTAFWNSMLLTEIARKISEDEISWSYRDPGRNSKFEAVSKLHDEFGGAEEGDFPQRLQRQVDRLIDGLGPGIGAGEVTEVLYSGDIHMLLESVAAFLELKESTWVLIDNLDKGWPTRGASPVDILIVRALLEASRKLQRQLDRKRVEFRSLVFLRNDVYEHLVEETPDRGKETPVVLNWDDREMLKEMLRRRIVATTQLDGSFDGVWGALFEPTIGVRPTVHYLIDRTLMRPRDLLMFIRRAVQVAINRGHGKVTADDIKYAEEGYSNDMLEGVAFELRDIRPGASEWLYAFLGSSVLLSEADVRSQIETVAEEADVDEAMDLLVWFGFLGVAATPSSEIRYAFETRYDLSKLLAPIVRGTGCFAIHPAFRLALECT